MIEIRTFEIYIYTIGNDGTKLRISFIYQIKHRSTDKMSSSKMSDIYTEGCWNLGTM
jgi:hypothetical protein